MIVVKPVIDQHPETDLVVVCVKQGRQWIDRMDAETFPKLTQNKRGFHVIKDLDEEIRFDDPEAYLSKRIVGFRARKLEELKGVAKGEWALTKVILRECEYTGDFLVFDGRAASESDIAAACASFSDDHGLDLSPKPRTTYLKVSQEGRYVIAPQKDVFVCVISN